VNAFGDFPTPGLAAGFDPAAGLLPAPLKARQVENAIVRQAYRIGGVCCLVGFDGATGLHPLGKVYRVPHGSAVLAGLVNLRGRVVPLFDPSFLLDAVLTSGASRYMLTIEGAAGTAAILIDGVPSTRRFSEADAASIPQLPAAVAACAKGAYSQDGSTWIDFDHRALCDVLARHVSRAELPRKP
jgi:chemotaxis signal transduction protein